MDASHARVQAPQPQVNLPSGRAVKPVIVSASRATDIPAFYGRWLQNRIKAGYVRWVNPFNATQNAIVSFERTRVFVFWTKNAKPMFPYLSTVEEHNFNYYFQFTLNNYEDDGLEPHLPSLASRIQTFKELSIRLGSHRVVWRFDPLILTDRLSIDVLINRIQDIAEHLHGFTRKLVISFADIGHYKKVQSNLARADIRYQEFTPELMREFASKLRSVSRDWGVKIGTCSEQVDLAEYNIEHNRCVDDQLLIENFSHDKQLMDFLGYEPDMFGAPARPNMKDKGQRKACGCIVSKDIGAYNTCPFLCTYCYATASRTAVESSRRRHDEEGDALVSAAPCPNESPETSG